ncbi:MAG: hypothetical protein CMA47_01640 [Euryarchaeota archaeon]|nr:hypothetical protein [Euryarchaeota archaeon]
MFERVTRSPRPRAPLVSRAIIIAMLMVFVALVSPSQARDFESSWVVVESGTSEDLLTAVDFENQVWAFGTGGVMLNSSDNGITWESVESPTNYDIHHSDSGFGSLVVADDSGLFLLKQNLESEWLDISLPEVSQVNGISLLGDQSVVAVGDGGAIFRYSEGVWESFSLAIEVDLMAVSFYDDKSGVIVGSSGTILLSDDGGLTWDYREAPEGAGDTEIIAVEYYSISRIYAITGDGRILMSANNVAQGIEVGYIWVLIDFERHYPPGSDEPLLDPSDLDVELTSVQVVTTTKLMMTGAGGYLSISTNGGSIVSQQINPLGSDTDFNHIHMLTGFVGIAVGDDGAILWTDNAGVDDQVGFSVPDYENFGVFVDETKEMFLGGFIATVKIVAFGIILGFFLGVTLAMCKTSPTSLKYLVERFQPMQVKAAGVPILFAGLYMFNTAMPGTRGLGLQGIEYIFLPVGAPESFARILLGIALTFVGLLFLSNNGKFSKIKIRSFTLNPWRVRPLNTIATVYTDFFRNTPLIVQFLFLHFGLELGSMIKTPGLEYFSFERLEQEHNFITDIFATYDHSEDNYGTLIGGLFYDTAFISAFCALGFNSGAYQCETIRGAIQAIPSAQMEAGRSIGLTYLQTMRRIIMPQAIRICIPPMGNEMVNLVLNSSLAMIIGYSEITRQGKLIVATTFQYAYAWGMVLISYFVVTWTLAVFLRWMEEKTRIPGLGISGGD